MNKKPTYDSTYYQEDVELEDPSALTKPVNTYVSNYSPGGSTLRLGKREGLGDLNIQTDVTVLGDLPVLSPTFERSCSRMDSKDTLLPEDDEIEEVGFQSTSINHDPSLDQSSHNHNDLSLESTKNSHLDPDSARKTHIQATKDVFTDEEKFAYVGLVRLLLTDQANKYPYKFLEFGSANASYTGFGKKLMRKLYQHLEISEEEQLMIDKLSSHGVITSDLSRTILNGRRVTEAVFDAEPLEELSPELDSKLQDSAFTKAITIDIRWTIVLDLFLMLTSADTYDSRSRTLLKAMSITLELDWFDVIKIEKQISEQLQINDVAEALVHNSETGGRKKKNHKKRMALMGVATVGGGLIIGLSAGLLAPAIGAGLGAAFTGLGLVSTSSFLSGVGGLALITTGGVISGGTIAGQKMEKRTRGVDIFQFFPVHDQKRSSVLLSITGWLPGKGEDVTLPFAMVDPIIGDHFSLLWEPEALKQLGNSLKLLAGEVLSFAAQEILKQTILSGLLAALALPMALTKLGYLVDNPWSNGLGLAEKAGLVLADTLLNHAQGHRPVSLVGFSLGARVIFYCLMELSRLKAYGIVENVYLFGAPVTASQKQWRECASIVAGRFVNGHVKSDWILGFLYRAASTTFAIAGLNPVIGVEGVENYDVSSLVSGHLAYRHMMPTLMKTVGIPVTTEEFEDDEEDLEQSGPSELEVSDNLEAIMAGHVPNPQTALAAHPKPKAGPRSKSWYDHSMFNRLRWKGQVKTPDPEHTQDAHLDLPKSPAMPKAKSPCGLNKDPLPNMELPAYTPSKPLRSVSMASFDTKKDPLLMTKDLTLPRATSPYGARDHKASSPDLTPPTLAFTKDTNRP